MIKKILFLVIFSYCALAAQYRYTKDNLAVVGSWAYRGEPTNMLNHGYSFNSYCHFMAVKPSNSQNIGVGVYGNYNYSKTKQNLKFYEGKASSYGFGLIVVYYSELPQNMYIGANLGVSQSTNTGSVAPKNWKYNDEQKDLLYNISINSAIWSKMENKFFPRTEFMIIFQGPMMASKTAHWNGKVTGAQIWRQRYLQLRAMPSLINFNISPRLLLSPKIVGSYEFVEGDAQSLYGLGASLSLHKPYNGDMFEVYYLYKISNRFKNIFEFGVNINPGAIF